MSNNINNLNVRFLVDVPPATHLIFHSSELKGVYVNKLRMDFLNYKGQDYFAKQCSPEEEQKWNAIWNDQAERRYIKEGDYQIEVATGEETFIDLNTIVPVRVCNEYVWYKAKLEPRLRVTITYMDCECNVQTIEDLVENLPEPLIVCAYDLPSVTDGSLSYSQPCPETKTE